MRLIILFTLAAALSAQTPDYGRVARSGAAYNLADAASTRLIKEGTAAAQPATCTAGELYHATNAAPTQRIRLCTATDTWSIQQVSYPPGTSAPGTCTVGETFFDTDATAGSNWYLCTATNTWTAVTSGVGGSVDAINTGAGKGHWSPLGFSGYNTNTTITATRAYRQPILVPAKMEFRYVAFNVGIASGTSCTGGTCGIQVAIYASDLASRVAYSTVGTSGGSPDINTTGGKRLTWAGGSAVSGGVLTLNAGVYWLVWSTDSSVLALKAPNQIADWVAVVNADSGTRFGLTTTAGATGNGGSFALDADLSAQTWIATSGGGVVNFFFIN